MNKLLSIFGTIVGDDRYDDGIYPMNGFFTVLLFAKILA